MQLECWPIRHQSVPACHDRSTTMTSSQQPDRDHMFRTLLAASAATALLIGFANASRAETMLLTQVQDAQDEQDNDRMLIVKDQLVVYDDGRNDLFCRSPVVVADYTYSGPPIYHRTMRCRGWARPTAVCEHKAATKPPGGGASTRRSCADPPGIVGLRDVSGETSASNSGMLNRGSCKRPGRRECVG